MVTTEYTAWCDYCNQQTRSGGSEGKEKFMKQMKEFGWKFYKHELDSCPGCTRELKKRNEAS